MRDVKTVDKKKESWKKFPQKIKIWAYSIIEDFCLWEELFLAKNLH